MNKKRSKPLDLLDPIVQEISKRYNLAPKVVAYLRAAFLEGHYTRQTLIAHIEFENNRRRLAIEKHLISTVLTEEKKEAVIRYTNINIEFRETIVKILKECNYNLLADVLKPRKEVAYGKRRFQAYGSQTKQRNY